MKRLICLVLCLATFCTIYANNSTDGVVQAKTKVVAAKTINLQLINLQQNKTVVHLMAIDKSETYYYKTIKEHNGFSQNLDLRELEAGRYILTVKTPTEVLKQVIRVTEDGVLHSDFK